MHCTKCGFKLVDNSKFCSKCGAEIHIPQDIQMSQPEIKTDNFSNSNVQASSNTNQTTTNEIPFTQYQNSADIKSSVSDKENYSGKNDNAINNSQTDIIGKEYYFVINIFSYLHTGTTVKFSDYELIKGKLIKKRIPYSELTGITLLEHVNTGRLLMAAIMLIFIIVSIISKNINLPVLGIALFILVVSLLDLKNTLVYLNTDKGKTRITISSNDLNKDEFIDTVIEAANRYGNRNIFTETSSKKFILSDIIALIIVLLIGGVATKAYISKNLNSKVSDNSNKGTINTSKDKDKGKDTDKDKDKNEIKEKPVTQSSKISKETEESSKLNENTKELQFTEQDGIYKYIGTSLTELKNDLGEPDYDPETHKSQYSSIGGGYVNSYIYGNKVFEYIEYDYSAVDDNTPVNCVYVYDGEYLSDEVHVGMTFEELSKYIYFSSTSPVNGTMNPVAEARSIVNVNGNSCELVAEFPMDADSNTPSTAIYIWCKDLATNELTNQQSRMEFNQNLSEESYDNNEIIGTVNIVNNSDPLNVRSSYSTSAEIIDTLGPGAKVKIIEKYGDWYSVIYRGEHIGFVHSDYILLDDPNADIPEAVY